MCTKARAETLAFFLFMGIIALCVDASACEIFEINIELLKLKKVADNYTIIVCFNLKIYKSSTGVR